MMCIQLSVIEYCLNTAESQKEEGEEEKGERSYSR